MASDPPHPKPGVVTESFAIFWHRLQAGDSTAAQVVFDRYAQRLIGLARQRMDLRLRQRIDPEDIAQSVLVSFFHRQADGRILPQGWNCLWSYLAAMTVRKLGHHLDFHQAARRNLDRERICPRQSDDSRSGWEVIASEPTPEQAAILTDLLEQLVRLLRKQHRPIVQLALEGFTQPEIASRLNLSLRTVERVLKSIRERWERADSPTDESGTLDVHEAVGSPVG